MDGARAVWVDEVGGDLEIILWNGTTVAPLTVNAYDDETPSIRGNDVVWVGFPDSASEGEIFHWDGSTIRQLTDDDLDDFDPHVSTGPDGPTIAWVKTDGDDEIWVFDGCESTQITDESADDASVALDGNRVAWVRGSGSSSEVWTARFECNVVCGDGATAGDEECDDGDTDVRRRLLGGLPRGGLRQRAARLRRGVRRRQHGRRRRLRRRVPHRVRERPARPRRGVRRRQPRRRRRLRRGVLRGDLRQRRIQAAAGEECDDGNTVSDDGCSATCQNEPAAPLPIQRCIAKLNERGAAVAKAQHGLNVYCLNGAAKATLPSAQACLTADPVGKVAKARGQDALGRGGEVRPHEPPELRVRGRCRRQRRGGGRAARSRRGRVRRGPRRRRPAEGDGQGRSRAARRTCSTATQQLSDRLYKAAFKEKKLLLAGKDDGTLARSDAVLQMLLTEFLLADATGKIAAQESSVRTAVRESCTEAILDAAFPGCAPSATRNELASCAIGAARCRFCRGFNAFDGLAIDCDTFDDDLANASCP